MYVVSGINRCPGFGQWTFKEMPMSGNGWKTVHSSLFTHTQTITLHTVYRVHWLWAKAQKMRWIEELQCLQVEMESAVRFFRHQEQFWQVKQELLEPWSQSGHAACSQTKCNVVLDGYSGRVQVYYFT